MKRCTGLLFSMLLGACASAPPPPPERLFNDQLFLAPSERISASDVFKVSEAMTRFLSTDMASQLHARGQQQGFIDALYTKGQLRLEYNSAVTRNAAQTFAARSGNCLSLVIMTAALAKELGMPVRYQRVYVDDIWRRSGDVYFTVEHVNLGLGRRTIDGGFGHRDSDGVTVDFLPSADLRYIRTETLEEQTIVAMYMNNRAAEAFSLGQLNDAYWWARAAIAQDPRFATSYNTLGVIYTRHGNPREAQKALATALEFQPDNTQAMSNLIPVLKDLGRGDEAKVLARKLDAMEPNPPFSFFDRGLTALRNKDFRAARDLFAKEVDRAPYNDEFHYWLAVAYVGLGENDEARRELDKAVEYSTPGKEHDLYAAKLARIRSSSPQ